MTDVVWTLRPGQLHRQTDGRRTHRPEYGVARGERLLSLPERTKTSVLNQTS